MGEAGRGLPPVGECGSISLLGRVCRGVIPVEVAMVEARGLVMLLFLMNMLRGLCSLLGSGGGEPWGEPYGNLAGDSSSTGACEAGGEARTLTPCAST